MLLIDYAALILITVAVIISMKMIWTGYLAGTGEMKNAYKRLGGVREATLVRPMPGWDVNKY
jgi:hypothetical protein